MPNAEWGRPASDALGRESYYELREPLVRLCIEVKKNCVEPIRLLVDFLRLWYSRTEIQQQLEGLRLNAEVERSYLNYALLESKGGTEDSHVAICLTDYDTYFGTGDFLRALQVAEELVAIRFVC